MKNLLLFITDFAFRVKFTYNLLVKRAPNFFDYKVYVACSLTHASPEFRHKVELFKKKLNSICNVLRFVDFEKKASAYDIYRWDIHECVNKSDLVVAICDQPSIGLGWEMGTQIEARKMPCLALAHETSLVTAFVLDPRLPCFEFARYSDLMTDGVDFVTKKLKKIHKAKQPELKKKLIKS